MSSRLAEFIVVAIVLVWLLTVAATPFSEAWAELAVGLVPIMGIIAGGAIAVLTIARKTNGGSK